MDSKKYKKFIQHLIALNALVGFVMLLSGCELLGPELGVKLPMDPDVEQLGEEKENGDIVYSQLENTGSEEESEALVVEEYIGTGKFVSTDDKKKSQKKAEGKYTLNFDEADLREVTKIILSDMLGENYVMSPKVGGKVTLQTTRPLTKEELLPTLEMLYQMNNVALLNEDGTYRVEPIANALQGGGAPELGQAGKNLLPGYQIKIIPLEYVGVNDMMEVLKPLIPPKAILRVDVARNMLMVAGSARELERILDTVQTFDVNLLDGMSFGLYPLDNIDVGDAVAELEKLTNQANEGPLAGMFRFIPMERLNAIMVITPQSKYLKEVKKWIVRLDRADSVTGEGVVVYRCQHVDAIQLAETLNSIFSGSGIEVKRKASLAPGRQAATMSNKAPVKGTKTTSVQVRKSTNNATELSDLTDVRVIADEPNNALIVIARPQQYKIVHKIIKQLDVMPLQVLIDATIVAVKLTDDLKYGVQWKFKNSLPGDKSGLGILSTAADGALNSIFPGFSYIVSGGDSVDLILNMLASRNALNVISAPSLMVLNNQEATIQVGDQVPIRTSESTNTSGGGINPIQTSNIEMRDTGVTLKVTPRVNANGVVLMDIDESVDTAQSTTSSGIDSPTITQRKINSSIAVISGETIVLGGLISETHTLNKSGIPFLHELPWIGDLFGTTTKNKVKDELIVMITPRVIENKHDARKVAREFKRKLTGIFEDMPKKEVSSGELDGGS